MNVWIKIPIQILRNLYFSLLLSDSASSIRWSSLYQPLKWSEEKAELLNPGSPLKTEPIVCLIAALFRCQTVIFLLKVWQDKNTVETTSDVVFVQRSVDRSWLHEGNTEEENNGYVLFNRNIHRSGPVFVNVYEAQESIPESIPPVYVAWRAGTISKVVVPARQPGAGDRVLGSFKSLQIRALLGDRVTVKEEVLLSPILSTVCFLGRFYRQNERFSLLENLLHRVTYTFTLL